MNVPFLLPSRRLVYWGAAATAASLGVLVFPAATLLLLTVDLVLVAAALLDWLITPGAEALEAARLTPDRLSVLCPYSGTLLVTNRQRNGRSRPHRSSIGRSTLAVPL